MITTLLLIRHAETDWNREGRIQGYCDSPLSDEGRAQTMKLWKRLSKMKFSAAYSSDSGRCIDTARRALGRSDIPLETTADLRERNLGKWEGRLWPDVAKEDAEGAVQYKKSARFKPPEGETWLEMQERVNRAVSRILTEQTGRKVVIFTSGGPVRSTVMSAVKADADGWAGWSTWNTGVSTLENKEGLWRLVKFNDTSHLED